jgi:nucleotide-binding universal stress UspA family protein
MMSIRYQHIAVCMDRSPASDAALAHAVDLAAVAGARLSMVHVGPYPLLIDDVEGAAVPRREDLNAASRRWIGERAATVPGAHAVFLEGSAGPAVCAWAEGEGVDLLVLGAHHGWRERILLGSVSSHVVNHASCPVLVVRWSPATGLAAAGTRHQEVSP